MARCHPGPDRQCPVCSG